MGQDTCHIKTFGGGEEEIKDLLRFYGWLALG
jgi:hypothetical protein